MRSNIITAIILLMTIVLAGCSGQALPTAQKTNESAGSKPDWRMVTLHIDGFKKSKSGGT